MLIFKKQTKLFPLLPLHKFQREKGGTQKKRRMVRGKAPSFEKVFIDNSMKT